ncbi:unnamed protein product [Paramecium sonneborni]|uniref:Uncharacterized protein n=1 Tax=Paramecium sonneborni TaxID=65129 RepID=A0A8S1KXX1_9CILI|nr:unnamed protein product [Paramecium sonneborni]
MFLGRKIFRAFCSQAQYNIPIFTSSRGPSANKHLDDVLLDQMIKGFKKAYTDRFLLDFKKVVLPAKRVRSLDDHIVGLWKQHEVAVVIEGRDEFEDIDIVLDYYQVAAVKRRICANVAPIYIRIPGHNEDIRCTLGEIIKDPKSGWPFKVTLRRYIVGRPNLLYVPIALLPNNSNPALVRGTDYDVHIEGVWINSYNATYPTRFLVDVKNLKTYRPYKLGDLQNTFPQGVLLHERYKKMIHWNVVTQARDEDDKFFEEAEFQRSKKDDDLLIYRKPDDAGEETIEGEMLYQKKKVTVEKKQKKRREKSLKKKVKQANQELQKEVAAAKEAKDAAAKEAAAGKK